MKKILLTSVLSMAMIIPAFATDESITQGDTCDYSELNTYDGTANIEAIWNPNSIKLDWYDRDTKLSTSNCTYDTAITLPATNPTRTGYTFRGWKLKTTAVQVNCSAIATKAECNATDSCVFVDISEVGNTGCQKFVFGNRCHTFTSQNECNNGNLRMWQTENTVGSCWWYNNECLYSDITEFTEPGGGEN